FASTHGADLATPGADRPACPVPPALTGSSLTGRAFLSDGPDELPREVLLAEPLPGGPGGDGQVIVAPLVTGGRLIGALSVTGPVHADGFEAADLAFAEDLARSAAIMIE